MCPDIADSIRQDIKGDVIPGPSELSPDAQQCAISTQCGVPTIEASKLNLVFKSHVKEPLTSVVITQI